MRKIYAVDEQDRSVWIVQENVMKFVWVEKTENDGLGVFSVVFVNGTTETFTICIDDVRAAV